MVPEDNAHHHLPEQHHPVLGWFLMFLYTSTMAPWLDPPLRVAPLRCRRFPQPTASLAEMWCWGFAQPIPEAISNQIKTEETSDMENHQQYETISFSWDLVSTV